MTVGDRLRLLLRSGLRLQTPPRHLESSASTSCCFSVSTSTAQVEHERPHTSFAAPPPEGRWRPPITFLEHVQQAALSIFGASGFDPKRYVNLSLKSDLPAAERAFDELRASATAQDLETFMRSYFEDAGGDLEHYEPPDYTPEPEGFLPAVKSREVREWALEAHALWKSLSRKISDGVRARPARSPTR
ncbi:hypothetical protein CDL15_Pgr018071 [Punica granatum]|uniref:Alpha,alpha-trehalose glucohydrolase n=1 Tax=Punica granatum TaxID=22663 RepID=A0A218WH82_PUNGR|nr:hypothetical protein CDL15_Pgr018071 [Punica granatum]